MGSYFSVKRSAQAGARLVNDYGERRRRFCGEIAGQSSNVDFIAEEN